MEFRCEQPDCTAYREFADVDTAIDHAWSVSLGATYCPWHNNPARRKQALEKRARNNLGLRKRKAKVAG